MISATGRNDWPGTVAQPKAITWLPNLVAGDEAHLRGDTYVAKVQLSGLNGTSGNEIIIKGYNGEIPVISGGWDKTTHPLDKAATINVYQYRALFELNDSNWVNVSDIKVINSNGQAFGVSRTKNCIFDNLAAEDIYGMTFSCVGNGPGNIDNQYITLQNSHFYNVCVAHNWWHTYVGPNNTYVRTVPSSVFFGRGTENCTIRNCTLERAGAEGFVAARGSRYITFENCVAVDIRHTCYYVATTQYSTLSGCVGYFTSSGTTAIPNTRGQGIVLRDEEESQDQGYQDYLSRNNTVENCLIVNAYNGYTGYGQATMTNFTLRNFTAVNCINGILNRGVNNSRVVPSGNMFENNIFTNHIPYADGIFGHKTPSGNTVATTTGATYQYNLWYDVEGSAQPVVGTGDVTADPLLENANFDLDGVTARTFLENNYATYYQPTAFSPAVGASGGTATTSDLLGRAAVGTRDIGALEYTSDSGGAGGGAITHGTTTEYSQSGTNTGTFAHNHDGDTLIVVCHGMKYQVGNLPFTFTTATFNGESLTLMDTQQNTSTNRDYTTAIFYGQPVSTGSQNVVVNTSRSVQRWHMVAVSVNGADATAAATVSKGTTAATWSASTTLGQGDDLWWAVTARGDSNSVSPGANTEEYETLSESGGLDTDLRAAAVWQNFPGGGSQTLSITSGPQSTRAPTWIFFKLVAAALYDVTVLLSAANGTSAASGPTVAYSTIVITPGAASITSAASGPTVGITGAAAITVAPGAANVNSATDVTYYPYSVSVAPGAASATSAAHYEVNIYTIVLARLFVLQARRRVFTLPKLRDR